MVEGIDYDMLRSKLTKTDLTINPNGVACADYWSNIYHYSTSFNRKDLQILDKMVTGDNLTDGDLETLVNKAIEELPLKEQERKNPLECFNKQVYRFVDKHRDTGLTADITAAGEAAAAAAMAPARIWDATTGEVIRALEGHGGWVNSVAWSPDGRRVATGSRDTTARIWDVATDTVARTPAA